MVEMNKQEMSPIPDRKINVIDIASKVIHQIQMLKTTQLTDRVFKVKV